MLSVKNISKTLPDFALRSISFDVQEGEYFVLLGPSGAGKTILLEILAGLVSPENGTMLLNETDLIRRPIGKRDMALVYQDQALFPHLSVRKNIGYGLREKSSQDKKTEIERLANSVGAEALLSRSPGTLSGGEAQRIALARALATKPKVLMLDEPISSLDTQARDHLRTLLRKLHADGLTIIHVTHDLEEAISLATRVAIIEEGQIVQTGTPLEVFHNPRSEFVARFVGFRNFLKGELIRPEKETGRLSNFLTDGLALHILTDANPGEGYLILRPEDLILSRDATDTSARNTFSASVREITPARLGLEVKLKVGSVEMIALITHESVEHFALTTGEKVQLSFKATAARFIGGQS